MKKLSIWFPLLFLGLVAFGQTDSTGTAGKKTWRKLAHTNFKIHYPVEWALDETGVMGTSFILFAPLDSDKDKFKENINLNMVNLGGTEVVTMEAFAKAAVDQIENYIEGAKVLGTQKKERRGLWYYEIEFTGKQGQLSLHWKQQYWFKGPLVFILTFTAEETAYGKSLPLAEKMLATFEVL
ncbi:MAG: hypothetical protein IT260_06895 [Saprospiraceae bacterium]|nr:hypothetical protein [Saprospiraceae bacterium]